MIFVNGFLYSVLWPGFWDYFPELSKSFVVIDEHCRYEAEALFQGLGVYILTGHGYLEGFIGDLNQRNVFVEKKVNNLVNHFRVFSDIALTQPQLAYTDVTRSLQHELTFLLRIVYTLLTYQFYFLGNTFLARQER